MKEENIDVRLAVIVTCLHLSAKGHGSIVPQLVRRANVAIPWNYCPTCEDSRPMIGQTGLDTHNVCLSCGNEAKPLPLPERMIVANV